MREVVIVGAARTPIGSFQGELGPVKAPELGKIAIQEALRRSGVPASDVNEVYMGCVLPAGLGQAPARQAAIFAGLPNTTPCTTVNKVCGSGLKAVMLAAQSIQSGDADVVVAGGMESMSNVPYYLPTARAGMRMGHQQALDGMIHDGLWDVYNDYHMGTAAELCAREKKIDRAAQDAYAIESFKRSLAAQKSGAFKDEIVAVDVPQRKGAPKKVELDEGPARGDIEKIPSLKPAFQKDGTVTAGNASTINDGAAALIVCAADVAKARGWKAARPHRRASAGRAGARVVHDRARDFDRARAQEGQLERRATSTCSRSTRPSPSSPSPTISCSASTRRRSTSTAAESRSAIPSARRARAF